jgi:hypothetical protein
MNIYFFYLFGHVKNIQMTIIYKLLLEYEYDVYAIQPFFEACWNMSWIASISSENISAYFNDTILYEHKYIVLARLRFMNIPQIRQ